MKKQYFITFIISVFFCFPSSVVRAQSDSIPKRKKPLKNTVNFNLTSPIISSKYNVIGYERTLGEHQSVLISFGRFSLPRFGGDGIPELKITRETEDVGLHAGLEYRFYLKNENKNPAPRGVYIGPYVTYKYFNRENTWVFDSDEFTGEVNTRFNLNMGTVGFQLGYQFIFWRRVALDLILVGPGISYYKLDTELNTNMTAEEESAFFQKLNSLLAEKIPGYNIVFSEGSLSKSGSFKNTKFGYRYLVNIGFRF